MPFQISFDYRFPFGLIFLLYFFLFAEIILQMNLGFMQNGIVINDRREIIKNYLFKGKAFNDFLSFLPIMFIDSSDNALFTIFLQVLVLLSAKPLLRNLNYFDEIYRPRKRNKMIMDLIKLIISILTMCHIFGCFWFLVGRKTCLELPCWIKSAGLDNESISKQYIMSLYWSVVTIMTVGYGDISPINEYETIIALITIMFGGAVFMYNINYLGMLLSEVSKDNQKIKNYLHVINNYMERKNIPGDLQLKIRHNIHHICFEESLFNEEEENEIIKKLPKNVKEDLLLQANGSILNKMPFLVKNFSQETLTRLVYKMKEIRFAPDDLIFHQHDSNYEEVLLYVENGEVELFNLDFDTEKRKKLAKLKVEF